MSEWRECKLGDVAEINPTESLRKGTLAKKIPMDALQPFTKKIPKFEIENYNGGVKFRNGDTLVARITPSLENGKTSYVDVLDDNEIGFGSTEFIVLREKKNESDKHFLYYLAMSTEFRELAIKSMTGSSGRQRVQNEVVFGHEFLIPPLEEQKAIAEVLSSLDDKIDLLHRQNRTLESLAQTLFRQWFIEEAKDEWEVGTLNDIVEFNPSYKLKQGDLATYLAMENVQTDRSSASYWYKREVASGAKFMNNDTLLARITPSLENGKTAFVDFLENGEVAWGSTEFIVMRMKSGFHPFVSYLIAKNQDFRDFAIGNMTGSTGRQRAQAEDLKKYEIVIPPFDEIQKLNELLEPIPPKIKANWQQIQTLEKLRDTLLPKLLSGQVRVKYEY
jgi:type I restriction enzyme, S subunit